MLGTAGVIFTKGVLSEERGREREREREREKRERERERERMRERVRSEASLNAGGKEACWLCAWLDSSLLPLS